MKPAQFQYLRPADVEGAIAALATGNGDTRVLAGGQSLVPLMNLRMARPTMLVDLSAVTELSRMERIEGGWRIGAMVTQAAAAENASLAADCPLVAAALPWIGHLQIRSRGTVGGSVAHADPAAELPAVCVALDASINVSGPAGSRSVPAAEFFVGPYTTALQPGELLTSIDVPDHPDSRVYFSEFVRRKGDFAIAGVALAVGLNDSGGIASARAAAFGVGGTPVRLHAAEAALVGSAPAEAAAAAGDAAAGEVDPWDDAHGSGSYRRDLVSTLVRRGAEEVAS